MKLFPDNVKHLSTQRFIYGGRSSDNFENFNLALHLNDIRDNVVENRKILRNRNLASRIPEIKTILEDRIITLTFIQKFKTKNLKFLIFKIRITTEIRIFHK